MFSPKLRLLLIGLFAAAGIVVLALQLNLVSGIALLSAAAILLLGHFRHGAILSVLAALRNGNISKAQELIQSIKRPDWLSQRFKGYYYFSLSLIATYSQDATAAEENASKALEIGNLPVSEQGILYYNLARAAYEKQDWTAAKRHLATLENISTPDLHLKQRIAELQEALATV